VTHYPRDMVLITSMWQLARQ